ncbi:MAG: phosphoadenylyl-sulfate reductase [Alphaproteobacteria bacterium]|nr:phosphoadenylyl-sulfate reductase [Alphaproteobacteria bacterium]
MSPFETAINTHKDRDQDTFRDVSSLDKLLHFEPDTSQGHVKAAISLIEKGQEILGEGKLALVSSFGAESAVLLHLVSRVDKNFPVFFLDTGKHFKETLDYVDLLSARLRLTNVQFVSPNVKEVESLDPNGDLHKSDPDTCCAIRKVAPLAETLKSFNGWITGRKRFHGGGRATLPLAELDEGKIKLNPIVDWSPEQIEEHFTNFGLPSHALTAQGYTSIGCEVCTNKPTPGSDTRSGRWQGKSKFECGIHKAA